MPLPRARVVTLNAALGPLDYRVPEGMAVEPGTVVIAPLGPRQLVGVAWEAERLHYSEISLVGSFHYSPADAREALRMLAAREVDPAALLTERGSLSDLPRFLAAQANGEGIRYVVRP